MQLGCIFELSHFKPKHNETVLRLDCRMHVGHHPFFRTRWRSEFAEYGVGLGISPFGPSLNLTHNFSEQTSVVIGLGGFGVAGTGFDLDFNGDTYTTEGETSWMGVFVNHGPFADASWFRVNSGIGSVKFEDTLTSVDAIRW